MISRETFFSAKNNVPRCEVKLPGDNTVYVRGMTLGESEAASDRREQGEWASYIVSVCTVDQDGNPFFEENGNDIEAISKMPRSHTEPIHTAALKMSGMLGNDQEKEITGETSS